jgi:putative transposase
MPRPLRTTLGGLVYHVLNRANGKRTIFHGHQDYLAFERVLGEAQERVSMRLLAWCLMPNHWHLLLWPRNDGDLSKYVRLATLTHAQRLHANRESAGTGHIYQGRFKSFVVQNDAHFLTVARYVEANALRANLAQRAEDWRWSSLWRIARGRADELPRIHSWPVQRPTAWLSYANESAPGPETDDLRRCTSRGAPYGDAAWVENTAQELGLRSTLRPRGRPPSEKVPDTFLP